MCHAKRGGMRIGTGEGFRVGKVELYVTAPHAEGGQLTHDDVAGEHSDLRDLRPAVMRLVQL